MRNAIIGLAVAVALICGGNYARDSFGMANMQDVAAGADRIGGAVTTAASAIGAVLTTLAGLRHHG